MTDVIEYGVEKEFYSEPVQVTSSTQLLILLVCQVLC